MVKNVFFELKQSEFLEFNNLCIVKDRSYALDCLYFIRACSHCDKFSTPITDFNTGKFKSNHKTYWFNKILTLSVFSDIAYICTFCKNNIIEHAYFYEVFVNSRNKEVTTIDKERFEAVETKIKKFQWQINSSRRFRFVIGNILIGLCVLFAAYKIILIGIELAEMLK